MWRKKRVKRASLKRLSPKEERGELLKGSKKLETRDSPLKLWASSPETVFSG